MVVLDVMLVMEMVKVLDGGFSNFDQKFYLSYSQNWRQMRIF